MAYARIQGKAALVAHFQNSSLMSEDKRCRPILFHSEGQETGDQVMYFSQVFYMGWKAFTSTCSCLTLKFLATIGQICES